VLAVTTLGSPRVPDNRVARTLDVISGLATTAGTLSALGSKVRDVAARPDSVRALVAMPCPDDTQLSAFIARTLSASTAARLEAHIADCDDCRNLLFALATSSAGERDAAPLRRVGRFEILDVIGEGAMGVVYRGRDPDLDRVVAIKVRRSQSRLDPDGEERMRREAQALARLTHPNVVAVYETGRDDRTTYIVMEHVEGTSLADWLTASPAQPAIIDRMIEAGRGLAAAHAVGLVHRDFKPRNVLVATTGAAKVGDFGLARLGDDAAAPSSAFADAPTAPTDAIPHTPVALASTVQPRAATTSGPAMTLTLTGSLLGTPAYMSPEQLRGEAATEASDQFSFCVTLYEALYGKRPFVGTTIESLLAAMTKPLALPAQPRVPRSVARTLLRGLAIDPVQRFASMAALLDVLDDRTTRRRRRGMVVAVAAAALVTGGGVIAATRPTTNPELCAGGDKRVAEVWSAARKAELRRTFLATDAPFAADAWRSVETTLDRYAGEWTTMHRAACEATNVRGEQSAELLDLRMWCLDDRLRDVAALTAGLAKADGAIVARAVDAAGKLPDLKACADARALAERQAPRDPAARQRIEQLQAEVARGAAAARLGNLDDSVATLARVIETAKAEGYAPLEAEARLWHARNQFALDGDPKAAEQRMFEALWAADRGRDDHLRARAWVVLTFIVGNAQARFEEAHRHIASAKAAIGRLVGAEGLQGQLLGNEGQLLAMEGKHDEAGVALERATELLVKAFGPDHIDVGLIYAARSELESRRGNTKLALDLAERGLAIHDKQYGPHHPETAKSLFSVARAYEDAGEYEQAAERVTRVMNTMEKAVGKDHPDVAIAMDELGKLRTKQLRFDDALALTKRALEIREKGLPPDHPDTSVSLDHMGNVLTRMGRAKEALPYHQRALAIVEKVYGADHIEAAGSRSYLATCLRELDRNEEALAEFRRALTITEQELGPDHYDLSFYLSGIGNTLLDMRRPAEAIAPLERSLRVRRDDGDQLTTAEIKFALARALWDSKRDRARARALVVEAREPMKQAGNRELDDWLAKNPQAGR
jgi:tetratricopeptide (TPR) repeat protein/tRNA A-37 threonylcarbamoyl transferase component Bud32